MTDVRSETLDALRRYAVRYQESAHDFATWMRLPTTDGVALCEILWAENVGDPLSAARLRTRIGLTSGAANALVNRLEERGLVRRSRESTDRRIVSLRVTETARRQSSGFFGGPAEELNAALAEYDPATLSTIRDFLDRFAGILPTGEPS